MPGGWPSGPGSRHPLVFCADTGVGLGVVAVLCKTPTPPLFTIPRIVSLPTARTISAITSGLIEILLMARSVVVGPLAPASNLGGAGGFARASSSATLARNTSSSVSSLSVIASSHRFQHRAQLMELGGGHAEFGLQRRIFSLGLHQSGLGLFKLEFVAGQLSLCGCCPLFEPFDFTNPRYQILQCRKERLVIFDSGVGVVLELSEEVGHGSFGISHGHFLPLGCRQRFASSLGRSRVGFAHHWAGSQWICRTHALRNVRDGWSVARLRHAWLRHRLLDHRLTSGDQQDVAPLICRNDELQLPLLAPIVGVICVN